MAPFPSFTTGGTEGAPLVGAETAAMVQRSSSGSGTDSVLIASTPIRGGKRVGTRVPLPRPAPVQASNQSQQLSVETTSIKTPTSTQQQQQQQQESGLDSSTSSHEFSMSGLDPKYLCATPRPRDGDESPSSSRDGSTSTDDSDNDNSMSSFSETGKKRTYSSIFVEGSDECLFSPTFGFGPDEVESSTVGTDSPRDVPLDEDVVMPVVKVQKVEESPTATYEDTYPGSASHTVNEYLPATTDECSDNATADNHHYQEDETHSNVHNTNLALATAQQAALVPVDEGQEFDDTSAVEEEGDGNSTLTESGEFCPYSFIKSLPPYREVQCTSRPVVLPPKDPSAPRITLVLDLDETLVHCSTERLPGADMTFPVEFNGTEYTVYMRKRPFLDYFMHRLKGLFEIVVFTASQKVYADRLLDLLDPDRQMVHHRVFRDACINVEGNYLKDLSVLGRDLKTTVIVDNSPQAFAYHLSHGIPIESWFDEADDEELLKLLPFLETLSRTDDVRPWVSQKYKSRERVVRAPGPDIVESSVPNCYNL